MSKDSSYNSFMLPKINLNTIMIYVMSLITNPSSPLAMRVVFKKPIVKKVTYILSTSYS
jgi:hypothetical protein